MIVSLDVSSKRSRVATGLVVTLAVAAAVGALVWHSSHTQVHGTTAFVLRLAVIETQDMGGLVRVTVPVTKGIVALDTRSPMPSVYRPDPEAGQITLIWLESPAAYCGQVNDIHVDERADAVVVQLSANKPGSESCAADARQATATIQLSMPLGTRPVVFPWQPPKA